MAQDVISLVFPGEPRQLLDRYAEGARRWQHAGRVAPENIVVAAANDGLLVTLVWGEGVDHHDFGSHMLGLLDELGLPFPNVTHAEVFTDSWMDLGENSDVHSG